MSEVLTQTDSLTADVSFQVSGCRDCLGPLWEAWTNSQISCIRCSGVDRVFMETIQLQESQPHTAVELSEGSVLHKAVHHNTTEESWKLVTSRRTRKAFTPPEALLLRNRFSALQAEEELGKTSREAAGQTDPVTSRSTWKKRWGDCCG